MSADPDFRMSSLGVERTQGLAFHTVTTNQSRDFIGHIEYGHSDTNRIERFTSRGPASTKRAFGDSQRDSNGSGTG